MADSGTDHRILVAGGGYAGLTAAARIGERDLTRALTLIDSKPEFVERIRLHEIAAGTSPRSLPYAPFMAERGARFVCTAIESIDATEKTVRVRGSGGAETLPYDTLIYALGSGTDRGAVPGISEHATVLDSPGDAWALRDALTPGKILLIAGGGLTAIEAACEIAERLPAVQVVLAPGREFGPSDAPGGLSTAGFSHIEATLDRLGVKVYAGARIKALTARRALFEDGAEADFDVCLWAAGFRVPTLARDAGIAVTNTGQIVTDETLASVSHPDVIAVGDAAHVVADPGGKCRMSCAAGRPMGERAAETVAARLGGKAPAPFGFGYAFRCISLGRDDGLIQFVDAQDRPVDEVWTGARGARWKEYICRRTLAGVGFLQNLGPPPDTPPQPS